MTFSATALAVPEQGGLTILAQLLGLLIGVIFHEVAHGYVALRLGDPTAKYAGRLSLNPLKHVDMWGSLLVPALLLIAQSPFVIGWAKPVPVNFYNLRDQRWGPLLVALAGPATNLLLLIFFSVVARLSPAGTALPFLFVSMALVSGALMMFNLIPIPPLDGSKVLFGLIGRPTALQAFLEQFGFYLLIALLVVGGPFINVVVLRPALELTRLFSGLI